MHQVGSLKLTMDNVNQAMTVFSFVKKSLECWEYWEEYLTVHGRSLMLENEKHLDMVEDYLEHHDLLLEICKEIAKQHPEYTFYFEADGCDDEGYVDFSEEGTLKDGRFDYRRVILTRGPCEELGDGEIEDALDAAEIDDIDEIPFEHITTVTGTRKNGRWSFKSKEKVKTEDWIEEILQGD